MYNLANLLATGRGVVKDHTTAYRLYRQAAELGHAKSMNLTGRCLEDGCGVARMSPRHTPGMHARPKPATSAGSSATLPYCWHRANGEQARGWLERALRLGHLRFIETALASLRAAALPQIADIVEAYARRRDELRAGAR